LPAQFVIRQKATILQAAAQALEVAGPTSGAVCSARVESQVAGSSQKSISEWYGNARSAGCQRAILPAMQPAENMTRLNLLTDEGPIAVLFTPALESAHYSELFRLSKEFASEADMRAIVAAAAERWGRDVVISSYSSN